jgi:hypothetical protein
LSAQYQSAKSNQPFRAAEVFGPHFDPLLCLPTTSVWIASRHGSQFRRKRTGHHTIRTSQTYHQDYHPDRTFHGLFLLECESPGSGNPHADELYSQVSSARQRSASGVVSRPDAAPRRGKLIRSTVWRWAHPGWRNCGVWAELVESGKTGCKKRTAVRSTASSGSLHFGGHAAVIQIAADQPRGFLCLGSNQE